MIVYVLMSCGLPIPQWEHYLPPATDIYFEGEKRQEQALSAFTKDKNIVFCTDVPKNPSTVLAFWNGTADFVDSALGVFISDDVHLFLPTEDGFGFEEYIRQPSTDTNDHRSSVI